MQFNFPATRPIIQHSRLSDSTSFSCKPQESLHFGLTTRFDDFGMSREKQIARLITHEGSLEEITQLLNDAEHPVKVNEIKDGINGDTPGVVLAALYERGDVLGLLAQQPGVNINAVCPTLGQTALQAAIIRKYEATANVLLELPGIKVDAKSLEWAISNGMAPVVEKLFAKGIAVALPQSKTDKTPSSIDLAIKSGVPGVLTQVLSQKPAESNEATESAWSQAITKGVQACLDAKNGPMLQAFYAATPGPINMLYLGKADFAPPLARSLAILDLIPEFDINTADPNTGIGLVHIFSHFQDLAALKKLVERGAKLDQPDKYGMTTLFYATGSFFARTPETTDYLLNQGVDVNALDTRRKATALMGMAGNQFEKIEIFKRLLQAPGIDLTLRDEENQETAFYKAAQRGHANQIQALLDLAKSTGRDVGLNTPDKYGRTPLDTATHFKNKEVIKLLKKAGAQAGKAE